MKKTPAPETFEQWLQAATNKLPAHICSVLHVEFESHFQDACEAHLASGEEPHEARHNALAELGYPMTINEQLLVAHVSKGQSLATIIACAGYIAILLLFSNIAAAIGGLASYVIQDVFSTFVLIFILTVFVRLIGFNIGKLFLPARLMIISLILGTIVRMGHYLIFNRLPFIGLAEGVVWETSTELGVILDIGFLLAELLAAIASGWLGWRLYQMEKGLYGLLRPIGVLFMLVCLFAGGLVIALLAGNLAAASIFTFLGYVSVTILLAVLVLVFFRASFRQTVIHSAMFEQP
jgi:hypothetical protein